MSWHSKLSECLWFVWFGSSNAQIHSILVVIVGNKNGKMFHLGILHIQPYLWIGLTIKRAPRTIIDGNKNNCA
jgi:hypothetical protein